LSDRGEGVNHVAWRPAETRKAPAHRGHAGGNFEEAYAGPRQPFSQGSSTVRMSHISFCLP
jgi:hypothetical protein